MPDDPPDPIFTDAQLAFLRLIFPYLWRQIVEILGSDNPGAAAALGVEAAAIIQRGSAQIAELRENIEVTDTYGGIGTVSVIEVDGRVYYGLNGSNYADDAAERAETQAFQQEVFPRLKSTKRQALYHAEAQSILRLANDLGDAMPAELVLHVDRKTCGQCIAFLPKLCKKLGIAKLTIIVVASRCGVLENGRWEWLYPDAEADSEAAELNAQSDEE